MIRTLTSSTDSILLFAISINPKITFVLVNFSKRFKSLCLCESSKDTSSIVESSTSDGTITITDLKAYDVSSSFKVYMGAFVDTITLEDSNVLVNTIKNNSNSDSVNFTSELTYSNVTEANANPINFTFNN